MIIELCNKKEIWIISLSLKCVDVDIFLIVCDKNAEEDKKCRCARIRWSCTESGVVKSWLLSESVTKFLVLGLGHS